MEKQYIISLDIYEIFKIEQAIADFSDVAEIRNDRNAITIDGQSEGDIEETFKEFMNYVLSL